MQPAKIAGLWEPICGRKFQNPQKNDPEKPNHPFANIVTEKIPLFNPQLLAGEAINPKEKRPDPMPERGVLWIDGLNGMNSTHPGGKSELFECKGTTGAPALPIYFIMRRTSHPRG